MPAAPSLAGNLESKLMADLTKLQEFDFVFLADASGSMSESDCPGGLSRWNYMQESMLAAVREIEKFDSDGIDLVIFGGSNVTVHQGVTSATLKEVFASRRPSGSTPTAQALTEAFKLCGKNDKKDFVQVWTDGVPDDKAAVAKVLVDHINAQPSDDAFTTQFVQVGNDVSARAWMQGLDDNLAGAQFDAVDLKSQAEVENAASAAEVILAGIDG
jgi:hypothetical protein